MDFGLISVALLQLVSFVVVILIGVASAYVKKWADVHVKDTELKASLAATLEVIETSVKGSVQVMSAETELALADGKLDPEELKKIQDVAIADYKQHVAPELQKRLDAHVLDAQSYVAKKAAAIVQGMDTVTN